LRLGQTVVPFIAEQGEAVTDRAGVDQAHGLHGAGLAEEALAGPGHERVGHQPQLVDEVVLDQRPHEPAAGVDDDLAVHLVPQRRYRAHHVSPQDRRVVPGVGILEGGRHDVLGHAVQPVSPLTRAGWEPCGEILEAAAAEQQGLGVHRLGEQRVGPPFAVLVPNPGEPVPPSEALLPPRVLDDSVQRDVFADDDPSHLGSPSFVLSATTEVETARSRNWAGTCRPVRAWIGVNTGKCGELS
jgi:hypothetical protein